jgi:hypothetical protein
MRRSIIFATLCLCCATSPSCKSAGLEDVCVQSKALLATATAYYDDAKVELERARTIARLLPPEAKAELLDAIDKADAALYASNKMAIALSNQCDSFNPLELFDAFSTAWDVVKVIFAKQKEAKASLVDPEVYKAVKSARLKEN